jgi:C4-dicarboxylate transporter DctQ subunit
MAAVLNRLEEGLMAFFLAVMTFLTALQVLLRYVFNSGLIWSLEATTYSFAWLVLLGMSYGVRTRSHIAVEMVVGKLTGRAQKIAVYLCLSICIAYALLMLYGGIVWVSRLYVLDNQARDLPVARWLLTIALPLGFALLAWRFIQLGRMFYRGDIKRLSFGQNEDHVMSEDNSGSAEGVDK